MHGRLRTDPDALTLLSGVSLEEGDVGADQKHRSHNGTFRVWLGGCHEKAELQDCAPTRNKYRIRSYNFTNRGL